jgi:hypothetical protein
MDSTLVWPPIANADHQIANYNDIWLDINVCSQTRLNTCPTKHKQKTWTSYSQNHKKQRQTARGNVGRRGCIRAGWRIWGNGGYREGIAGVVVVVVVVEERPIRATLALQAQGWPHAVLLAMGLRGYSYGADAYNICRAWAARCQQYVRSRTHACCDITTNHRPAKEDNIQINYAGFVFEMWVDIFFVNN